MSNDSDMAFMPAWKLADMVRKMAVSPVELVEFFLERTERLDPLVGAFITVCGDRAIDEARRMGEELAGAGRVSPARNHSRSARGFFGVPVSLKDMEATQGIRTTLGSRVHAETVPESDSVVAERTRSTGAIVIGKTNTPEIAIHLETVTDNEVRGPCRNPWDTDRTTGGSSGGAGASLALGMCPLAVGSDGGGSIRIPAAFCGVFGIKATQGRVPRARGLGRPDPNQFAQSGPMSNYVLDSAIMLQALSGPHELDPQPFLREPAPDLVTPVWEVMQREASRPLSGLRVAWSADLGHGAVDPEVAGSCQRAAFDFDSLGAAVEHVAVKFPADLPEHFWNVFGANAYVQFGHWLEDPRTAGLMGVSARTALERGRTITGAAYSRSLRAVNELRLYVDGLFEKYDLLLTPTTSIPAFDPSARPLEIGGRPVHAINGFYPFTFPFNMTHHPAATVPCGFVSGVSGSASGASAPAPGLPVGLQVVGRRGGDAEVLRACAAFETARPWQGIWPALAGEGA